MRTVRVALAGNPNCGKSTIFNSLTGGQQHVGNWPGKTVARKEGEFAIGELQVQVVDLPGTYSLSAYSPEEQIARDYIVLEAPDLVINVLDAANLERNLYLTTQILETGVRTVVMLNMSDVAARRGYRIDTDALAARLGVPVIAGVATQGAGMNALQEVIVDVAGTLNGQDGTTERIQARGRSDGAGKHDAANGRSPLRGCH